MNNSKFVSKAILAAGILNTLLGAIHIIGTFTFEPVNIRDKGTAVLQRDYLVWFCATGAFILFMGLLSILCYSGLKKNMNLAWKISLLCSGFTALLGVSGVIIFGISPPVVLVVTGIFACITLILHEKNFC